MNNSVVITDSRTQWMIAEDKLMSCMTRCRLYKECATRVGVDCKRLGGSEIPKIRN
ncbi:hypothetical protein [Cytobacillus sp. IB215665]|uniref:hypothetical protein n=1 Tax=Cytobacillus sp. IB215665 TaxID=3097357 RepID=UPI002A11E075|nr:hypothetical protein [Cytobacillus sp. IB215665]MDX8367828.1 hypothetical protein [Cytobacillus sp. IB215665]